MGDEKEDSRRIDDPMKQMEGLEIAVQKFEGFPSASKVQQAKEDDSRIPNPVAIRRLCEGYNGRRGWPAVKEVYQYWKNNGEIPEELLKRANRTTQDLVDELRDNS